MFRTSNPAFRNDVYGPAQTWDDLESQGRVDRTPDADLRPEKRVRVDRSGSSGTMTVQGTVNKTFFLLALCTATAVVSWTAITQPEYQKFAMPLMLGGGIAGFVLALVCIFKPKSAVVTAPLYSLAEGLFVGGISGVYAMRFANTGAESITATTAGASESIPLNYGLIFNAILLTFGITGGVLIGYTTRLIRPGKVFYGATIAATLGICVYGMVALVAAMFGSFSLASVYDPSNGGLFSLLFSGFVILLASANLVLDFDLINNAAKNRAPKYMEWYSAFGVMVTLIWLYLEVLRLLAKLRGRD